VFTVLAAIVFWLPLRAQAQEVVFTDLGPGDSFSSEFASPIWGEDSGEPNAPPGIEWYTRAVPFTPIGSNYSLAAVELAVDHTFGSNRLDLWIVADENGRPGSLVEEFNVACEVGPFPPRLLRVESTRHPRLLAGRRYWLVAGVGARDTIIRWFGSDEPEGLTAALVNGLDWLVIQGWGVAGVCHSSAFRITGYRCGNGTSEPGEDCDDGNTIDGDGCDSDCTVTGSTSSSSASSSGAAKALLPRNAGENARNGSSGGDVPLTGTQPTDQGALDTADQVADEAKKKFPLIIKCHRKTLKLVSGGKVYDKLKRDECVQSAKDKILAKLSGLVPKSLSQRAEEDVALPCAASEADGLEGAVDLFDAELVRNFCPLYCCGTEPLPDTYCGYVPETTDDPACTFKTIDKVSKALEKFGDALLDCHGAFVEAAVEEGEADLDLLAGCELEALQSINQAIDKIRKKSPLPECVEENLLGMELDILLLYRQKGDQVLCEGSEPLDPRGCCDRGAGCSDVADEASCAGIFVPSATCNAETAGCRPTTCPFPSSCDAGENCINCPENCGPCPCE
jgi:cysteine-rich repeat protein